jgi:hypothetical protein
VEHTADEKFIAGAGIENFEAKIRIALPSGRILSATMNNPVDITERTCSDAALTQCADETHYRILRKISLEADSPSATKP